MECVTLPELTFPLFPSVARPIASARDHTIAWLNAFDMLQSQEAIDHYLAWDMAGLAAYGAPYARGEELDLITDMMAFFFLFDDQFDGPIGMDPLRVREIVQAAIAIIHASTDNGPSIGSPILRAYADMWRRGREGMSTTWCIRAAYNWEYYFAAHVGECIDRCRGVVPPIAHFWEARRGFAGSSCVVDMVERLGHFELPPEIYHLPQIRLIRRAGIDIPILCNDIFSAEKEALRGDVDNMVFAIEREGYTREQAFQKIRQLIESDYVASVSTAVRDLPYILDALHVHPETRKNIDSYVNAICLWIAGFQQWQTETLRYKSGSAVSPDKPNYVESLFA